MERVCPNCGAPISSWECPYCGAVYYDFSSIDATFGKPIFLRINYYGKVLQAKVMINQVQIDKDPCYTVRHGMYMGHYVHDGLQSKIDMSFDALAGIVEVEEKK